jgi:hypothetical protein
MARVNACPSESLATAWRFSSAYFEGVPYAFGMAVYGAGERVPSGWVTFVGTRALLNLWLRRGGFHQRILTARLFRRLALRFICTRECVPFRVG